MNADSQKNRSAMHDPVATPPTQGRRRSERDYPTNGLTMNVQIQHETLSKIEAALHAVIDQYADDDYAKAILTPSSCPAKPWQPSKPTRPGSACQRIPRPHPPTARPLTTDNGQDN